MARPIAIILITLSLIGGGLYYYSSQHQGNISQVSKEITQTTLYSKQEVNSAMRVVERHFQYNFKQSKLLKLTNINHNQIMDTNPNEVIVIASQIDQDTINWILTRNDKSMNWQIKAIK